MQTTRASLLVRIQSSSDSVAWNKFAHIYMPLVRQWVTDLGIESNSCNDVVQEVFVTLLSHIKAFRYDASKSFRGWLRTVTINKCRDFLRKKNRAHEPQFLDRIETAERGETELLTEKEYREFVARSALQLMKQHFSETTWKACWLSVTQGLSPDQVAEQLGISRNAVYLARGRVLQRLRQELAGLWE